MPQWQLQTADRSLTAFDEVRFVNERVGWILGGTYQVPSGLGTTTRYVLLGTRDGGATWTSVDLSGLQLGNGFRDLWPVTENVLYASGVEQNTPPGAPYQFVYKSQDGGRTWQKLASAGYRGGTLLFLNESVGFSASGNVIVKTTDGGQSWAQVWDSSMLGAGTGAGGSAGVGRIQMVSQTTGYATGGIYYDQVNAGVFLKTTDGGATWQDLRWMHEAIAHAQFITADTALVACPTTRSRTTGYRAGQVLYQTTDGGRTWQQLPGRVPGGAYYFLSSRQFFCAGDTIQRTQDRGRTWQPEYAATAHSSTDAFEDISFTSSHAGYAVSREGLIVKRILP